MMSLTAPSLKLVLCQGCRAGFSSDYSQGPNITFFTAAQQGGYGTKCCIYMSAKIKQKMLIGTSAFLFLVTGRII